MIDTHAHIYSEEFDGDIDEVIKQARETGLNHILMPNIDSSSAEGMMSLAGKYPKFCLPMMGLHPCSVKENYKEELKEIEGWLRTGDFIAVGEIGTDLYWDKTFWKEQQEAFKIQCELALDYDLPVAIHCRESIDETITLTQSFADRGLTGVFHCFTGTVDQARNITGLGFYLGLGGVATFKNGGLDKVIPELDFDRILLETDSPYLAPTPFRGKRNEPAMVDKIADKVAYYLGMEKDALVAQTDQNAKTLFRLDEL